jgi:hypothetical protein
VRMREPDRPKFSAKRNPEIHKTVRKARVANGAIMASSLVWAAQPYRTCFVPDWAGPKLLGRNNVPVLFWLVKCLFRETLRASISSASDRGLRGCGARLRSAGRIQILYSDGSLRGR